ncbi:hypothetical protein F1880_009695 [Penicillium rolfsii]|nr:hypothetical protein F1880_009695 [Penicillium rolfsii]
MIIHSVNRKKRGRPPKYASAEERRQEDAKRKRLQRQKAKEANAKAEILGPSSGPLRGTRVLAPSNTVGANLATQVSSASEPTTQQHSGTPEADDYYIPHVVDNPLEWPHSPFSPRESPNGSGQSFTAVENHGDPRVCAEFISPY